MTLPPATAAVADACLRLKVPLRLGPPGLRPIEHGARITGPAVPARHAGSVDVFLEALESAPAGGILVVDNGGRLDEACVGDLTIGEAKLAGLAGVVVWGLHRDTAGLRALGLPVLSLGALPTGPQRLDARADDALAAARVGDVAVARGDLVVADDDGVAFVAAKDAAAVVEAARAIEATERRQLDGIQRGVSLRSQLRFAEFLSARAMDPALTLREHLRRVGGAIEV